MSAAPLLSPTCSFFKSRAGRPCNVWAAIAKLRSEELVAAVLLPETPTSVSFAEHDLTRRRCYCCSREVRRRARSPFPHAAVFVFRFQSAEIPLDSRLCPTSSLCTATYAVESFCIRTTKRVRSPLLSSKAQASISVRFHPLLAEIAIPGTLRLVLCRDGTRFHEHERAARSLSLPRQGTGAQSPAVQPITQRARDSVRRSTSHAISAPSHLRRNANIQRMSLACLLHGLHFNGRERRGK
eukprot:6188354-Pleurochrysis_carterae.AAC.1